MTAKSELFKRAVQCTEDALTIKYYSSEGVETYKHCIEYIDIVVEGIVKAAKEGKYSTILDLPEHLNTSEVADDLVELLKHNNRFKGFSFTRSRLTKGNGKHQYKLLVDWSEGREE